MAARQRLFCQAIHQSSATYPRCNDIVEADAWMPPSLLGQMSGLAPDNFNSYRSSANATIPSIRNRRIRPLSCEQLASKRLCCLAPLDQQYQ
jgi:hypothetical protein